jgi:hypothetical protein
VVVSEAVWLQSRDDRELATRYASYLGHVYWVSKDPGRAFDGAAKALERPEVRELADVARKAAAQMEVIAPRPVAGTRP